MSVGHARRGAGALAAAGVIALVGAVAPPAHAGVEYDGQATALKSTPIVVTLFPEPPPDPFATPNPQAIQVFAGGEFGHVEYPGTDTTLDMPENRALRVDGVDAHSVRTDNGNIESLAQVSGLNLAEGALTAGLIEARCVGDGQTVDIRASIEDINGGELQSAVQLQAGTAVAVPGVGTITFKPEQDTDGATFGRVTNLQIQLDTNLSLDELQTFPEAAAAVEDAIKQGLKALNDDRPFGALLPDDADIEDFTIQELYDAVELIQQQVPRQEMPDLNSVAHLGGTVTIASVACSQRVTHTTTAPPSTTPPTTATTTVSPSPTTPTQPPLADTGSPAGTIGIATVGILALALGAGGIFIARRRGEHL